VIITKAGTDWTLSVENEENLFTKFIPIFIAQPLSTASLAA